MLYLLILAALGGSAYVYQASKKEESASGPKSGPGAVPVLDPGISADESKAISNAIISEKVMKNLYDFGQTMLPDLPVAAAFLITKSGYIVRPTAPVRKVTTSIESGLTAKTKAANAIITPSIQSGLTSRTSAARIVAGSEFGLWGVLDDLTDPIGDVANGLVDVIHLVPGVDWTGEQLKDFAKTGVGEWALRIVSTYGYYVAAPYLGAQMASVSFAMPGLLKAEPFLESWIKETMDRVIKTVEILIQTKLPELGAKAGQAAGEAFKKFLADNPQTAALFDKLMSETTKGVETLKAKLGKEIADKIKQGAKDAISNAVEKLATEYGYPPDFAKMAKDAGIREDSAAAAYDLIAKTDYQGKIAWDARTGQDIMAHIARAKAGSVQGASMTSHTQVAAKDKRFVNVQSGMTSARSKNLDARRKWVAHYLAV